MGELLDQFLRQTWAIAALPSLLLLGFGELGYRLGHRRLHLPPDDARKATIGGIQGAVLGLLGLLLGFTFAMAVARYDARRSLVVDEANAIGTTFLRASLLPETHVAPVQNLLRRYVALRLEYGPLFEQPAKFAEGLRESAAVQARLWEHADGAADASPTAIVATFVSALNEMIDLEAKRLAVARARIPMSIWALLLVVAALGCLTSCYAAGVAGRRSAFSSFALPLLIAGHQRARPAALVGQGLRGERATRWGRRPPGPDRRARPGMAAIAARSSELMNDARARWRCVSL